MMLNENLQIDPSQLDEEWLKQSLFFDEAQELAAECLKARDSLKDDLEKARADSLMEITSNWVAGKYNLAKAPTAPQVAALVAQDALVVALTARSNEANHALNLANNTVRSFEMRKSALAKLTDLWISNYFSTPNPNRLVEEGKRMITTSNADEGSAKATEALNENKTERKKSQLDGIDKDAKDWAEHPDNKEEKTERKRRPKRS